LREIQDLRVLLTRMTPETPTLVKSMNGNAERENKLDILLIEKMEVEDALKARRLEMGLPTNEDGTPQEMDPAWMRWHQRRQDPAPNPNLGNEPPIGYSAELNPFPVGRNARSQSRPAYSGADTMAYDQAALYLLCTNTDIVYWVCSECDTPAHDERRPDCRICRAARPPGFTPRSLPH
jgi:hypothetical protein